MNAAQNAAAPSAAGGAAAPSAAGGAAAAQQQQQPQSFLSRVGGIVMQLIFIQVVMQLVGNFTSPRVQQQQQQMPEQPHDMRTGGAAAGAGNAATAGGAVAGGGMLLPPLNEHPFLNLHPNVVLLNAFPPDTPFDAFLHLKYITVLEPSSRRRAAAAAWGPATVESDRLFYSQFFLPSETSSAVSAQTVAAGGGAAAAAAKFEDAAAAVEGSKSKEGERGGGLSGAWSNVLGSLRQLSPGAHATAATGSSVNNSGSRNLFPRVPLWALWRSNSSSAAAAARPKEVASIRLVLPPAGAAVGSRSETAVSGSEKRKQEIPLTATETADAQGAADETHVEEQQEIVYWGGNAVLLWQLLNQRYTYDRWSSSQEQVVSIRPPADFFLQFPLPAETPEEAETAEQQQQHRHEIQQQQRHETQQQQHEMQQQQQQRDSREEAQRTIEKEQQKRAEEELPEELKVDREEISKRKKRTMLCLITTVVPHSAYINGRPERLDTETAPEVDEQQVLQRITSLMQPMPLLLPREEEEHSLLLGGEGEEKRRSLERQALASPIVWHLKNRVDVSLVFDSSQHTPQNLRLGPMQNVKVRPVEATYEPVIYHSDFWLVEKNFIPLNETLVDKPLNLTLSFGVGSLHGWLVQEQLGAAIEHQQKMGLQSTREAMMFKRILIETNPFMLAFSTAFILLHSVFSFFAFKNDMQFWYRNDSMEGLSALSLIFNFVCEAIIGLYLFDSGETSWLILFEICLGIVLSAWKVTKAMRVKLSRAFPYVSVEFRKSYSDSNTKELDSVAIKWMSLILAPCVLGYAVYALIHNKYRSWYSYFISVLAGSVYTFGFITMTPQLYINYKLKSVDHLPWRALVYRSLNTFVDDVASFLIDMPWMHRLSCFRDDIIFICYLYQRWIYKVDETRVMGAPPAAGAAGPQQLHRDEDLLRQGSSEGQAAADREQLNDKSSDDTAAAASRGATNSGTAAMTCAAAPSAVAACRREASVHKEDDDTAAEPTQQIRQRQSQDAGGD